MLQSYPFTINVPGSIANIGPGFDVIAGSISLQLKIKVQLSDFFKITCDPELHNVSCDFEKNLITQTAYLVASAYSNVFPTNLHLTINNTIPIGKGFGSSAAAIVAGIYLANYVCKMDLSLSEMLEIATIIEGHPDNVAASIYGGIQTCLLSDDNLEKLHNEYLEITKRTDIYSVDKRILQKIIGPLKTFKIISNEISFLQQIRLVLCIPDSTLDTTSSRSILPTKYSKSDVVFNLQRLSMLILQLNTPDPDPEIFYSCLQDRLHQPYRGQILPDLQKILLLNPLTIPGLLGFCLSGAGPSIVALAKYNEDLIIEYIQKEYIQKECDSNNYSFLISNFTKTGASYKKVFKNI